MTAALSVLIIHHEPTRYFTRLCSRFPGITFLSARNDSEVAGQLAAHNPRVVLSFRCDPVSTAAQTLAARSPGVDWVQVAGAGYDHIGPLDELACRVTTCAGVLSPFHAETVMGAIINLNFGFHKYQRQQQEKVYRKLPWRSLEGQRLLLIGLGHIGRALAVKARCFGMHITAVRSRQQDSPFADAVLPIKQLPELLAEADFVSLHIPYNEATHHFFDASLFAAMKNTSFFINTARGNIVDEQALIAALASRSIQGAYLDVFSQEPLPATSPLWEIDSVLISPHYCDAVVDWHERFAMFFADNLDLWLAGQALKNQIHP